ncbi:TM0106 family RecB-like putative nuclease [Capillimicrobium parvum]|nr:TM0106 family RecB-like putative nuclease [Capillimicrobium parvum]
MADPPRLSPSALNRFLGCEHRTYLDILEGRGELDAERRPPRMDLLLERGRRHEQYVLDGLREERCDVVSLEDDRATAVERAERTIEAMRAGRRVIYQGCFTGDGWVGYPDFLIRVEEPSDLGGWSYEVHDAKFGRHAAPRHVFQLLFYCDALERLQGRRPAQMHLILRDDERRALRPGDFEAYGQVIAERFAARYDELSGGALPAYPYPVRDCEYCHWWHVCEERRRGDDHISLVAGLWREQGLKLERAGVSSASALAALDRGTVIERLPQTTLSTLRAQADLQVRSRRLDRPLYELLEPEHGRGLHRLPEPSPGDVYFDFEGDRYWGDEGLEYLFGTVCSDDGEWRYRPIWALSRAEEKRAFEMWVDWITERLERHPDLHVFHYNSYEPVALKAMMVRHATREHEVDELLRRNVFVDLYGITRQAVRAGIESYSLKSLEAVIGFERAADLRDGLGSMRRWQDFQDDGSRDHLDEIAAYNRDDCHSTRALNEWLLARRPEAQARFGVELAALAPEEPKPLSPRAAEVQARTDALRPRLLAGLPDDESEDDPQQRARRLAFHLTSYHRQEEKQAWWTFFDRRKRSLDELRDEDREAIGDLAVLAVEPVNRSWRWTLSFPPQEYKLGPGNVDEPLTERGAQLVEIDERAGTVVVTRGQRSGEDPPRALAPGGPYQARAQVDAVFAFAERIGGGGLERAEAGLDLLLRRPPRLRSGSPPLSEAAFDLARVCAQVRGLDRSALVIQGPPGTGKTWTGARIALSLMADGRRVGVMATAHKAINNLLAAIDQAADETGAAFRGWRKRTGEDDNNYESARIACEKDLPDDDGDGPVLLHAGTAWYWASDDAAPVDVLIVDEAGQVSLADAIAVAQAADSVVLLGDPQQLAHVSQGVHPVGSGVSVLEHLLGDDDTIPPDRGVFLETSWRMHPAVCDFVSRTMYDDRLAAREGCERQRISSPGLCGSGLRFIGVEHADNRGRSQEEATRIAAEVDRLVGGTYVDRDGEVHELTLADILVVAPYNAQVRCLKAHLPDDARVGTVDKFQGQEAPVVFFSMASSSGDDVTRGMSFLLSRNRLNVAVSRAQALAVVVCSPRLLSSRCSTVDDMRLVNMLCRFAAEATPITSPGNAATTPAP